MILIFVFLVVTFVSSFLAFYLGWCSWFDFRSPS